VNNPGFGVANGFMPSVKTFFVTPHAGRIDGEEKNALFVSMVPGVTSKPLPPDPPAAAEDIPLGEPGEDPQDSNPPTPEDPGGDDPKPVEEPSGLSNASTGCSVDTSGTRDAGAGMLAALGLIAAFASRRRKGA
jgi:MYXO-CTERM domain-containing protein